MTLVPGWTWQTMHWLRRDAGDELVLDRVARLVLGDRRVGVRGSVPRLPGVGVRAGVDRRAVVGVDRRGRRCSRWTGSRRGGRWCPRKFSVGSSSRVLVRLTKTGSVRFAVPRPRTLSRARGPAVVLERVGDADLGREPAAALEDPQDVARLARLEPGQRVEERDDALDLRSPTRSAAGRSGAAAGRRSCCSSRRTAPA